MKDGDQLFQGRRMPLEMASFVDWTAQQGMERYLLVLAHLSVIGQVMANQLTLEVGDTPVPNCWALCTSAVALRTIAQEAGFLEVAQHFAQVCAEGTMMTRFLGEVLEVIGVVS